MIKYFCDRCNKESDKETMRKIIFYDKGKGRGKNGATTIELCPECYEETMAFAYGYKFKEEK